MDVIDGLTTNSLFQPIKCLDMHTTGEPTRIVLSGYPELEGTLLEQRAQAQSQHDHIRRRLILEPRGHNDMYGAILRPKTELVDTGVAHIGVLFLTNGGYSTMCGHATIALGRFLYDTRDESVFPQRSKIEVDMEALTAKINLHAPCGLVEITVPVTADGKRSDPLRSVSFVDVPSFATGLNVEIELSKERRWPELGNRTSVRADFSYGGAFYCLIPATELGFPDGLRKIDFEAMNRATKLLKAAVVDNSKYDYLFKHPVHKDLSFLYSVMVVDKTLGEPLEDATAAETGLCYFADQSLDRSPTGSCVAAREALAVAKGDWQVGQKRTYHSLVSNASSGKNGFNGEVMNFLDFSSSLPQIHVRVSGTASYTGVSTFCVEPEDALGQGGFVFEKLNT